jgi:hypothetical protein
MIGRLRPVPSLTPVALLAFATALAAQQTSPPHNARPSYLAPGGRVAVIDFSTNWPEGHETLQFSKTQFEAWMTAAGYTRIASYDWLENSFFVIYR